MLLAVGLPHLCAADSRERSTELSASAPVERFSLPQFTREGHRSWLVRGAEARIIHPDRQIDITGLHLTVFTGDATERVESILLSAAGTLRPDEKVAEGMGLLRLIGYRDNIEVTGEDWIYDHARKKVSIRKNVRVVLRAPLKDLLK